MDVVVGFMMVMTKPCTGFKKLLQITNNPNLSSLSNMHGARCCSHWDPFYLVNTDAVKQKCDCAPHLFIVLSKLGIRCNPYVLMSTCSTKLCLQVAEVANRADVTVVVVSHQNRDALVSELFDELKKRLAVPCAQCSPTQT